MQPEENYSFVWKIPRGIWMTVRFILFYFYARISLKAYPRLAVILAKQMAYIPGSKRLP